MDGRDPGPRLDDLDDVAVDGVPVDDGPELAAGRARIVIVHLVGGGPPVPYLWAPQPDQPPRGLGAMIDDLRAPGAVLPMSRDVPEGHGPHVIAIPVHSVAWVEERDWLGPDDPEFPGSL